MKILRSISTAVLFFLVLAAPAAATPSIHLSVEPTEISAASPNITYHVSGESEVERRYTVSICKGPSGFEPIVLFSDELTATTFDKTFPGMFSGTIGIYTVCAMVTDDNKTPAQAEPVTFQVVAITKAEEAKTKQKEKEANEAQIVKEHQEAEKRQQEVSTFTIAPVPAVVPAPAVAPVAPTKHPVVVPVSKLAKALKQCKKLKNKKKRVKCERAAKSAIRR